MIAQVMHLTSVADEQLSQDSLLAHFCRDFKRKYYWLTWNLITRLLTHAIWSLSIPILAVILPTFSLKFVVTDLTVTT